MSLFSTLTRPVKDLADAVLMPFKALFVVGLCWLINVMTYNGTWWVQWVALGMGIATVVALARGLRALLVLVLVSWVGYKIYQRYGQAAREKFDAWVQEKQPDAAGVLRELQAVRGARSA